MVESNRHQKNLVIVKIHLPLSMTKTSRETTVLKYNDDDITYFN